MEAIIAFNNAKIVLSHVKPSSKKFNLKVNVSISDLDIERGLNENIVKFSCTLPQIKTLANELLKFVKEQE